jgi:hypothetical protein
MNMQIHTEIQTSTYQNFAAACLTSCQNKSAQRDTTRKTTIAEFKTRFEAPEQLLRLAMNEAEALAWQTGFPHLVFPVLAAEKARAVANWDIHQRAIRQSNSSLLRAA